MSYIESNNASELELRLKLKFTSAKCDIGVVKDNGVTVLSLEDLEGLNECKYSCRDNNILKYEVREEGSVYMFDLPELGWCLLRHNALSNGKTSLEELNLYAVQFACEFVAENQEAYEDYKMVDEYCLIKNADDDEIITMTGNGTLDGVVKQDRTVQKQSNPWFSWW